MSRAKRWPFWSPQQLTSCLSAFYFAARKVNNYLFLFFIFFIELKANHSLESIEPPKSILPTHQEREVEARIVSIYLEAINICEFLLSRYYTEMFY